MRIVCSNLSYVYNNKTEFAKKAVDDVSLTVEEGDFLGIIGHTGSGKSTFIQHLNGLIPVQSGSLTVGEYNLSGSKKEVKKILKQLRSKVGMVFQYPEYQLFAETVFEDVAFGVRNFLGDDCDVERLVKDAIETVELDYESIKNKSPFDLSGGQKRRVAIAGVIVTKPEIIILDEPVAGLDPLGKKELMRVLHRLHETTCKTVIIVSHDMDEVAENCNKVAVFENGKIIKTGTPQELFKNPEYLEKMRLDVPVTAYLTDKLLSCGVEIKSDFKLQSFIDEVEKEYKNRLNHSTRIE